MHALVLCSHAELNFHGYILILGLRTLWWTQCLLMLIDARSLLSCMLWTSRNHCIIQFRLSSGRGMICYSLISSRIIARSPMGNAGVRLILDGLRLTPMEPSIFRHKRVGVGVARSHLSSLGAWSKPLSGVTDTSAEGLALREGFIFSHLRGFSHVVMEVDCLEVVNFWSSRHNSRSIVMPIFEEIMEWASSFASFSVQHASRENKSFFPC